MLLLTRSPMLPVTSNPNTIGSLCSVTNCSLANLFGSNALLSPLFYWKILFDLSEYYLEDDY